jgi:hypothetical protein
MNWITAPFIIIFSIIKWLIFSNPFTAIFFCFYLGRYIFYFWNESILRVRLFLVRDNSEKLLEKLNDPSNVLIVVVGQMRSGKTSLMNWHASKCDFAYKKSNFYSDHMNSWLSAYDFQLDKPRYADDNLTCLYVDEMGLFFRAVEFNKVRKKYKGQAHLVKVSGHIDYKAFLSGQSPSDIWCEPRRVANLTLKMMGVKKIGYSFLKKKTYYVMETSEVEDAFWSNPSQGESRYRIIIDSTLLNSYDTKWLRFLKFVNHRRRFSSSSSDEDKSKKESAKLQEKIKTEVEKDSSQNLL